MVLGIRNGIPLSMSLLWAPKGTSGAITKFACLSNTPARSKSTARSYEIRRRCGFPVVTALVELPPSHPQQSTQPQPTKHPTDRVGTRSAWASQPGRRIRHHVD